MDALLTYFLDVGSYQCCTQLFELTVAPNTLTDPRDLLGSDKNRRTLAVEGVAQLVIRSMAPGTLGILAAAPWRAANIPLLTETSRQYRPQPYKPCLDPLDRALVCLHKFLSLKPIAIYRLSVIIIKKRTYVNVFSGSLTLTPMPWGERGAGAPVRPLSSFLSSSPTQLPCCSSGPTHAGRSARIAFRPDAHTP